MKKGITKAAGMIGYLCMLLYLMGFQIRELFHLQSFCVVILGMCLLSLPGYLRERNRENLKEALSHNALLASYIAAMVILTGTLSQGILMEDMSKAMAAGLRPVLYGLLFYVLLHEDKKEKETEEVERVAAEEPEEKLFVPAAEQIIYLFRAKGLTEREAEVARLLYLDHTNRMIAEELYISEATVKKHVTHILEKLEITSRSEVKEVVKTGI